MDTETIKKIIKDEYNKDIKAIYEYDDEYYVLLNDYFNSMMPIVDPELENSPGFVFIESDLGHKILIDGKLINIE